MKGLYKMIPESELFAIQLFPIKDFEGYYVSEYGKVYSTLAQGCRDRYNMDKRIYPTIVEPRKGSHGYNRVYLRRESTGKREDLYIHRIVALTFIPNPYNLPEIHHKDFNVDNNCVDNLQWVSRSDNLSFSDQNRIRGKDGRFIRNEKV